MPKDIQVQDTPTFQVGQTVRIRASGETATIVSIDPSGDVQLAGYACLTQLVGIEPVLP